VGRLGATALALALCLAPAAVDAKARRVASKAKPAFDAGFGSFTPAAADPRMAAAFARSGLGATNFSAGAFRFTPSANSKRAITVAVRARAVTKSEAAKALTMAGDVAPSAYSLGLSLGWKRFALSGDVGRFNSNDLLTSDRESADIGVSYSGKRWQTKIDLSANRNIERPLVGIDQSWSVGLGGTYMLTHNVDVSGGIRYKTQRDQFQSLFDDKRDGQAVYLGTTFRF
jgi:hypothetical protein